MGCASSTWTDVHEVQLNETLTERQIQLIRDTWDLLADDMEGTGLIIFRRLFQTDKDLKSLFIRLAESHHHSNEDILLDDYLLKKHANVVMEALGAAVECLEDSIFLSNVLVVLGQIHAAYRVRPQYLPRLWPAVRFGLKEVLQDVFTEEVEETWKHVFNYIISKMREGIRTERRGLGEVSSVSNNDDSFPAVGLNVLAPTTSGESKKEQARENKELE